MTIISVTTFAWPPAVRAKVIENLLAALAEACGHDSPAPGWWVNFRVIDEGSWGARGRVLSILDLLASGVFEPERATAIRAEIEGPRS